MKTRRVREQRGGSRGRGWAFDCCGVDVFALDKEQHSYLSAVVVLGKGRNRREHSCYREVDRTRPRTYVVLCVCWIGRYSLWNALSRPPPD